MKRVRAAIRHAMMLFVLALPCAQIITPALAFEREDGLRSWTTVSEEDFGKEDFTITTSVRRRIVNEKKLALGRLLSDELRGEQIVIGKDLSQWTPVNEAVLDEMRGGFQNGPEGVFMSFGIERSVFRNGELVTSMALNIPDFSKFASNPADAFTLVQNGPGNKVQQDLSALPLLATIIQNSLNNQKLQSETIINATVQALGLARSLELGHALSEATIDAIRH